MTALKQATQNTTPTETGRPRNGTHQRRAVRGGALRLLAFLIVGGLGLVVGQAIAGPGDRCGPGAGYGPMGEMGMGMDPSRAEARAEKMAKHMAVEADATPAQQEKLVAIAKAAAKDLAGNRERMSAHRQEMMAALSAPTIDRAKIEAMRAEHLKDMDKMSRRMTQAMTDAADVLNPEQRQKLAKHMAERQKYRRQGGMGPGMGGGMGGGMGPGMGR